jgi:hypothetical protein
MLPNPTFPHNLRDPQTTPRVASVALALAVGAFSLLSSGVVYAACSGPGAPSTTQTKCLTAIVIPDAPDRKDSGLRSFDISFVNPDRAEYYLGDRSNSGIDIIDTRSNTFKRRATGFVGVILNPPPATTVNNNKSGPDGVVSHGRWLYGGDGNSTLKVFDLDVPGAHLSPIVSISTGGTTRVDEMALTTDGKLLLVANNAEDPPFGTLFHANGDDATNSLSTITRIVVDPTIIPAGKGLSLEQPAWDPRTQRFYVSVPQINVPAGCTPGTNCSGGLLIIDPTTLKIAIDPITKLPTAVVGAFDPATNTGVLAVNQCGPNGATVGPHDNLLLGCTPANLAGTNSTLVINAKTKHFANIGGITGSDEVWFNAGDNRYYTGSSANNLSIPGFACPPGENTAGTCPALGVINAGTNLLIEIIPQGSGSHSVAADAFRNRIYVPQVGTIAVVGIGGDTTTGNVSDAICGTSGHGCVAVYEHHVDDDDEADLDHDRGDRDHDRGDRDR